MSSKLLLPIAFLSLLALTACGSAVSPVTPGQDLQARAKTEAAAKAARQSQGFHTAANVAGFSYVGENLAAGP